MKKFVNKTFNRSTRKLSECKVSDYSAGITDTYLLNGTIEPMYLNLYIDSQIHFKIKPYIAETSVIAQIVLEISDTIHDLTPRLYLDYGYGFCHRTSVALTCVGNIWHAFVPIPHMLCNARLDLIEHAGQIKVKSLVAQRADMDLFKKQLLGKGQQVAEVLASRRVLELIRNIMACSFGDANVNEVENHKKFAVSLVDSLFTPVPELVIADNIYWEWIERHENVWSNDINFMNDLAGTWENRPLLSIVMPVFDPPLHLLKEAIFSIKAQNYENWELCIADDASSNPKVRTYIERLAIDDSRIKYVFRRQNGHISEASNSAIDLAGGRFLVLMDNDDLLPAHALWTVAYYINKNPDALLFYSDEDKISPGGSRCEPYFKGGFDRFLMYGHNMFSHLGIYDRALILKVGGFRKGYEGAQDYDLTLRCLDEVGEQAIVHIPHILYHWRQIPGSTSMDTNQKNYAFQASKRAINDHFDRRKYPLVSVDADVPGIAAVEMLAVEDPVKVSVIIPTRDGVSHLRDCIASIVRFPDPLVEVIIVDNGSKDPETLIYLDKLKRDRFRFQVVVDHGDFNFSRLVNFGVSNARGEIICLLNDDTEILVPGVFDRARALLSVPDVGIVGARLTYPDGSIQHFGVHLGVGMHGVAEHAYLGAPDGAHLNFSKSRLLQQFSAVTGACLFMRKFDYIELGGCSERFPVSYNDIDLCLRVRANGLKIICDPAIRLKHYESKSRGTDLAPDKKRRLERDADIFLAEWGTHTKTDQFYSPNFERNHSVYSIDLSASASAPWKND